MPPTTEGLAQALNEFGAYKFNLEYHVPYKGDLTNPRDMIPPKPGVIPLTGVATTIVIQDNQWDTSTLELEDIVHDYACENPCLGSAAGPYGQTRPQLGTVSYDHNYHERQRRT